MSNEISEFFDIPPCNIDETTPMSNIPPIVHKESDVVGNATADYHKTRESMSHMITKGTEMIDSLARVAGDSESPRAYEVLSTYLKTLTEMNKALMELHKDAKTIMLDPVDNTDGVQENGKFAFVGSTEDLQEFLKQG